MGFGGYSFDAHEAIVAARAAKAPTQIFTQRKCHPLMDPHGMGVRESRDSDNHPNSLAVIFALDVTGSMGQISERLAKNDLPKFMRGILSRGVEDPQILFLAVGDASCDEAPLQVGQFESEAPLMDQWLTNSYLEGGGGPMGQESYELALYFASRHTTTDCLEKRGKKGYLFLTGDEAPYPLVSRKVVQSVFGTTIPADIRTEDIAREVREKYHTFFLIPKGHARGYEDTWRTLLGDHVIPLKGNVTCHVAAGIMALQEGKVRDLVSLAAQFQEEGLDDRSVSAIVQSLTPFAETLQAAGVPEPTLTAPLLPNPSGSPRQRRMARDRS
jgi:hypothetical protein